MCLLEQPSQDHSLHIPPPSDSAAETGPTADPWKHWKEEFSIPLVPPLHLAPKAIVPMP